MTTAFTTARGPAPSMAMFSPANATQAAKVCVIAEIGVNHDGRRDRAMSLMQDAKVAGADAVKFQLFDPAFLLSKQAVLADYQKQSDDDVYRMLDRLKLGADDLLAVRAEARRLGLHFIVTPFSLENVPLLRDLHVDAVKIASPDVVNLPLLRETAALGKTMIVSTGAADLEELAACVEIISDRPAALLHCVSSYPTPTEDASLGAMAAMASRYAVPVGYSDHTCDITMGAMAVTAGACVVEKHLTWDRSAPGPDHAASFDAQQFGMYIDMIRNAVQILGPRAKQVRGVEGEVRTICRQSVCIKRDLQPPYRLTRADLTIKRPGTGIPAAALDTVIGRRLARPVAANQLLTEHDLA